MTKTTTQITETQAQITQIHNKKVHTGFFNFELRQKKAE